MTCNNSLRLEGYEDGIAKFLSKIMTEPAGGGLKFVIENFLPIPEEFSDPNVRKHFLKTKYGHDNADGWCMENWGTTDTAFATSYSRINNIITFETFNSPPDKAIVAISEQFPLLKFIFEYRNFKYEDKAEAEYGKIVCQRGEVIIREEGKIKVLVGQLHY